MDGKRTKFEQGHEQKMHQYCNSRVTLQHFNSVINYLLKEEELRMASEMPPPLKVALGLTSRIETEHLWHKVISRIKME